MYDHIWLLFFRYSDFNFLALLNFLKRPSVQYSTVQCAFSTFALGLLGRRLGTRAGWIVLAITTAYVATLWSNTTPTPRYPIVRWGTLVGMSNKLSIDSAVPCIFLLLLVFFLLFALFFRRSKKQEVTIRRLVYYPTSPQNGIKNPYAESDLSLPIWTAVNRYLVSNIAQSAPHFVQNQ